MPNEDDAEFHFWSANSLSLEGRPVEALSHVMAALDIEPDHIQSLILVGETYLHDFEELGVEEEAANNIALNYFNRALAIEPKHAEAWSDKALVLLYMDRPDASLDATETGLFMLPLQIGFGMSYPPVHINVAETLFKCKVEALIELERKDEARKALSEAFIYCPGSEYLSGLTKHFNPK